MIIVYNPAGALVAFAGIFVGGLLVALSGSLPVGLIAIAAIWFWFGRSKIDPKTGLRRPSPAIFFIPMYIYGILAGLAVIPATLADFAGKHREQQVASDPRRAEFERDEAAIAMNLSDDESLSTAIRQEALSKVAVGYASSMRVRVRGDAVLVLLKLPDLKKMENPTRITLLQAVRKAVVDQRPEAKVYAGVRGKISYGGILTPTLSPKVAVAVSEDPLLAFYSTPSATPAQTDSAPSSDKPAAAESTDK